MTYAKNFDSFIHLFTSVRLRKVFFTEKKELKQKLISLMKRKQKLKMIIALRRKTKRLEVIDFSK